ncbi:hypothetical protein BC826DRAFT_967076 [Russula brevipes]|nr:hypothetical protein BC826DRAFT_967076 [Russula brevipes]
MGMQSSVLHQNAAPLPPQPLDHFPLPTYPSTPQPLPPQPLCPHTLRSALLSSDSIVKSVTLSPSTSRSPPPLGSAGNVNDGRWKVTVIIEFEPSSSFPCLLDAQPAAQPPRGQAQLPLQNHFRHCRSNLTNLVPSSPLCEASLAAPKANNETSHVDFVRPPERLHPTLSRWLKNLDKFSRLVDRLQELASASPPDLRPQLHEQVAILRSSFKKQQERCVEFLRLTEEYANRYLLDISAEIQQQSSFLDILEKRLDMAKTLYALLRPLPEDFDLLREVDFVLNEIRRCYTELDKFWTEEIRRAAKALKTCRIDPDDAKRWGEFKASLEQIIESWKGTDLGTIASTLSPALAALEETLRKVRASTSIAFSPKKLALTLRVSCGLTQNRESCLTFFRCCIVFAETITASPTTFMAQPTFSRLRASNDLQERVVALGSEAAGVSNESATQFRGSRRVNSVYKRTLSLQRRTTHELNTLLENVSSWIVFADGLPNVPPGGIRLGLLHDLADAWERGRASVRKMLAALTDDSAERLRCQALSLTLRRPRFSRIKHLFSFA